MAQNTQFRSIGLVAKIGNAQAQTVAMHLLKHLKSLGLNVVIERATAKALSQSGSVVELDELAAHVDLVIVVGGDGSLLGVGRAVAAGAASDVPVLGVNRGGLGFLADIHPHELEVRIAEVLRGEYQEEVHFLLAARVMRGEKELYRSLALNDVVVHAGTMSRMMLFQLAIDDQPVYSQHSDGVIIATPTGSTAYALSAGGPIMHPALDAISIVPMFPHTLTSRPIVVRGSSRIVITIAENSALKPQVSCDSQVDFSLQPQDRVVVAKCHALKLLHLKDHSFYEACRSKLDWASRLGRSDI